MKKIAWKEVKTDQMTPEITRRFISNVNATLARFELKKGAVVPEHKHESSQMTWIVEGCLRFTGRVAVPWTCARARCWSSRRDFRTRRRRWKTPSSRTSSAQTARTGRAATTLTCAGRNDVRRGLEMYYLL